MDAEDVVLLSTFVTLGSTVGGHLASDGSLPNSRFIIGGFFAMVGCALIAEVSPEVGGGLAIAIAGTAFVKYGIPAINGVYKNQGTNKPAPKKN